jgi:MFS family permease
LPLDTASDRTGRIVSDGDRAEARSLFAWWQEGTSSAKRALVAASLGWMLDSFDVMLWALVVTSVMRDLSLDTVTVGWLGSVTLLASAAGGMIFGVIAERYGRTRALMGSIVIYSVFTAACGFAQDVWQLALFRVLLGLGMGGEWASGAALVSETWPSEHRAKALGFMQSSWAIGYGAAALVTAIVLPTWGWRAVFFVGVLPAFLTVWVRRRVEEPEIWREQRVTQSSASPGFAALVSSEMFGVTTAVTLMNACTMFAWWGFNLWLPAYLSTPVEKGGIGLSTSAMAGFVVAMQVGMWFGYVSFGYISDWVGRKRAYVTYVLAAAALIAVYLSVRVPVVLLVLGPFVAFFATGYFSGFGTITAELYPTSIRATAQGFTYNIGRVASALAPWAVGSLAVTRGFGVALLMCSAAFVGAAVFWLWIPETKGRRLA